MVKTAILISEEIDRIPRTVELCMPKNMFNKYHISIAWHVDLLECEDFEHPKLFLWFVKRKRNLGGPLAMVILSVNMGFPRPYL